MPNSACMRGSADKTRPDACCSMNRYRNQRPGAWPVDRRQFLQHGLAATAAAGVGVGVDVGMPATAATPAKLPKPTLQALAGKALQGHTRLCTFHEDGIEWTVYE